MFCYATCCLEASFFRALGCVDFSRPVSPQNGETRTGRPPVHLYSQINLAEVADEDYVGGYVASDHEELFSVA
jgi:hypothetical protein